MGKHSPPYTPMCNRHLRYFLSDTERTEFDDALAEKQFRAVESVYTALAPYWQERLKAIIPYAGRADLLDSYIFNRLADSGATPKEIDKFYRTLRYVNLQIAIALGYVSGKKS